MRLNAEYGRTYIHKEEIKIKKISEINGVGVMMIKSFYEANKLILSFKVGATFYFEKVAELDAH